MALLVGAIVVVAATSTATEIIASRSTAGSPQAVTFGADAKAWCTDGQTSCDVQPIRQGVPRQFAVDLVTLDDTALPAVIGPDRR